MPRFNQTGPMGQGAMTGRKMGKCTNFGASTKVAPSNNEEGSDIDRSPGRGFGRRFGCGFGNNSGMGGGRRNRNRGNF